MHAAVDVAFDELWQHTRHSRFATSGDLEAKYTEALMLEHNFTDKVFAAANDVASSNAGPVGLLFDIDETIVKKEFSGKEVLGYRCCSPYFSFLS